jgi:outer membrane protein OmpA-like peptidoglycan-associated protein
MLRQVASTKRREDLGVKKRMSSSKENQYSSSQLKGLMDLLVDLDILNAPQKSNKESSSSKEDAPSQSEPSGSQSMEECQDSQLDADALNVTTAIPSSSEIVTPTPSENTIVPNVASATPLEKANPPDVANASRTLSGEEKTGAPNIANAPLSPTRSQNSSPLSPVIKSDSKDTHTEGTHANSKKEELPPQKTKPESSAKNGKENVRDKSDKPLSFSSSSLSVSNNSPNADERLQSKSSQPEKPEKPQEESPKPPIFQADLNQAANLETAPEQALNHLIESHWQKAQGKGLMSSSIGASNHQDVENSILLFERWQRLLLTQEVMDSRKTIADFKNKVEGLEYQIREPKELINLLLPLITEILTIKVAGAREEVARAIAPVVDEMIQHRSRQDKGAMSSALAPVLPAAVTQQALNSPGDLGKALAPEIGPAIKEQINLERDAMVDALYPVIGSTISKYMTEAIRAINEKVENAFSLEGLSRKIRARLQGISEAELILKEAMPFTIQAVFLIHKGSGLVIAEVQPSEAQHLESEMVAGMLTAIRSFVNDVIAQSGNVSEIDQIDYGDSKIILEVAGYCYLAAVTKGEPPRSFIQKMRSTLGTLVQKHGKPIELFDGDPTNVPEQVHQLLQSLTKLSQSSSETQKRKPPVGLIVIGLTVLIGISVPLVIFQNLSSIDRRREEKVGSALASDPELAVYRLGVDANVGTIKLTGKLPNQYLRTRAEQIAKKAEPELKIQNAIIPVELPPDPVAAQAEVKRVTTILNQMEGAVIGAEFSEGNVIVQGAVLQEADAQKVTQAYQQIPGVKSVTNTVQLQPLAIASRVYFDQGSSEVKSEERSKISQIKAFLDQYPTKSLKLVGHTDPKGTAKENQPLALERATKVRDALIAQGVNPKRLQAEGTTDAPIGVKGEQVPLLSRCVQFKLISP